jgi:hypothetical protein
VETGALMVHWLVIGTILAITFLLFIQITKAD